MIPEPENGDQHSFITAAEEFEEAITELRKQQSPPEINWTTAREFWDGWHGYETLCRSSCENAILQWWETGTFPSVNAETAYFICRRFDSASDFLWSLVLNDGKTVLGHPHVSNLEFTKWLLVPWWESHGAKAAFYEELYAQEDSRQEFLFKQ